MLIIAFTLFTIQGLGLLIVIGACRVAARADRCLDRRDMPHAISYEYRAPKRHTSVQVTEAARVSSA